MKIARDTLLGLVFGGGLLLLVIGTIFLSELAYGRTRAVHVVMKEALGLKAGDPVTVAGVKKGYVESVDLLREPKENARVGAVLQIGYDVAIREGYRIVVEQTSLLGGRVVSIDPGRSDGFEIVIDEKKPLTAFVTPDPIAAFSQLISNNKDKIQEAIEAVRDTFRAAHSGEGLLAMVLTNKTIKEQGAKIIADLATVTGRVERGEGTIGILTKDPAIARKLESVVTKLDEGPGVLPQLLNNPEWRQRIDRITTNVDATLAQVRSGEGSLGKLVFTDEAHRKLVGIEDSVQTLVDKVNRSEGLLGRLISDQKMGDDAAKLVASFRTIGEKLVRGEGTLGRLLTDETLIREAERLFRSFGRFVEDAREASPISTFSAVLFGAF